MPGWCHGTAGYVHLWTTAARVLAEPRWLDLAIAAAAHSWRSPPVAGHLCCGSAGQAYAMLALHRHTGDGEWLRRGRALAVVAARQDSEPGRFTSLYRGALGVAVLAADLEAPQEAAMPFFEPERW
jgi:serine/threonine-protein kinase